MVNAARPKGPKPPSQAAIARALGLSKAAITKYKQAGMPVSSVEAAHAWRKVNVGVYMRWPTPGQEAMDAIERVHALIPGTLAAVEAGCLAQVEAEFRSALRAVPASRDNEISLPDKLWDALTIDVQRAVDACRDELDNRVPDEEMSDREYDAQWTTCFWIAVARGQIRAT